MDIQTRRVLKLIKIMKDSGFTTVISQGQMRQFVYKYAGTSYKTWHAYKDVMRSFELFSEEPNFMLGFNWPNILKLDTDIAKMIQKERVFLEGGASSDVNNAPRL